VTTAELVSGERESDPPGPAHLERWSGGSERLRRECRGPRAFESARL